MLRKFSRYFYFSFWAMCVCFTSSAQVEEYTYENPFGEKERFHLKFHDEFDGEKLDGSKWTARTGVPRDAQMENQEHYFKPENVELRDGICYLWAKRDTMLNKDFRIWIVDGMKTFNYDFHFSSAEILTNEFFGYGMYEIRCKIPKGKGMWPAFWVYDEPNGEYNELDVFEFWNQRNIFGNLNDRRLSRKHHMSVHYNGKMSKEAYWGPDFSDDFHVFTLYWDQNSVEWYVDGDLKRIQYRYKGMNKRKNNASEFAKSRLDRGKKLESNVFPINEGLKILADLAVQSKERAPDDDTPLPQAMEIDYIRHYVRVK